jgi:hypothetical protein
MLIFLILSTSRKIRENGSTIISKMKYYFEDNKARKYKNNGRLLSIDLAILLKNFFSRNRSPEKLDYLKRSLHINVLGDSLMRFLLPLL